MARVMASSLADSLCRHAHTVTDVSVRVQLFRSIAGAVEIDVLREALEALMEQAGMRSPGAQEALLAMQMALAADPQLLGAANARAAARLSEADAPELPEEEDERRVPDYGRGRVLSLGERKSLARRADRRLLDRVLRDPHPDVIELLLLNPMLTENDVVRLCARRPNSAEILLRVFRAPRWATSPRVRRSLAMNPATPAAVVLAVVPLMSPADLRELARDDRVPRAVRRRCLEVLSRLPPLPEAPTESLH